MSQIPLGTASPDLVALAVKAQAGEEIIFTDHARPVAMLVAVKQTGHQATPELLEQRRQALARLRELEPYRSMEDPVAWQREIRQDRPLPGRD